MTNEDFIKIVQTSDFLNQDRKSSLVSDSAWMTEDERDLVAAKIKETKATYAEADQQKLREISKIEKAIKDFNKQEIPKLIKEKEKEERAGESEAAEDLLKGL